MTTMIEKAPRKMRLAERTALAHETLAAWRRDGVDIETVLAEKRCSQTGTTIGTCTCPQEAHGGANHRGACANCSCGKYRRDPIHVLIEMALRGSTRTFRQDAHEYDRQTNRHERRRRQPKQPGEWSVGPSDRSSCRKAIEYRERPPEGYEPAPSDKQKAHMGTIVHEGFRRRRKALYPWRQFEQDVRVPGLDRPGRFDEYDEIIARLVDAKTAGMWKWEQVGKYGVPTSEVEQAMIYAKALRLTGKPVDEVEIIYINRESGDAESFVFPYDEPTADNAITWLRQVLDMLDAGIEMPRDREGPSTDPICARYCPARRHCWNMDEAEDRGTSPEFVTLVKDDPDVEWALEQYDAAREVESEAKREKDRMKALLDGADLGQYGTMRYGKTGGRAGEPVLDVDARIRQLEMFYEMPAHERPRLADLKPPMRTPISTVSISIKRERVAKTMTKAKAAQAAIDRTLIGAQPDGTPGHCPRCVEFGHRAAHSTKTCVDVGCTTLHGDEPEPDDA